MGGKKVRSQFKKVKIVNKFKRVIVLQSAKQCQIAEGLL